MAADLIKSRTVIITFMQILTEKNNLKSFDSLTTLGVINFFTYSNEFWGDMSSRSKDSESKFKRIFSDSGVEAQTMLSILPEHNDNVRVIDRDNLKIHKIFQKTGSSILKLSCDAIVTKEKVPLILTPGDCAAVFLTGIDESDGKRFVALIHSGFTGAILDIVSKTITAAKSVYKFNNSDLVAAVLPYIDGKHYVKKLEDDRVRMVIKNPMWKNALKETENAVEVNYGRKLEDEIAALGIKFESTGMDTYKENAAGNLFSQTYLRDQKLIDTKRFGVGICLK